MSQVWLSEFQGFANGGNSGGRVGIVTNLNGGTITVSFKIAGAFHPVKTYTADEAFVISPTGFEFRITRTGAALFAVHNATSSV